MARAGGADLADVHLDARRAARPDPAELARWPVGHVLGDFDSITGIDPLDYEDVLGELETTVLREPATGAWRRRRTGWAEKYLMERPAKAGGDVDAVIAVHAADLAANGHTHLVISRLITTDVERRCQEALREGKKSNWLA